MTGETIKFLVGRPDLGNWRRPYSSLDQITASKITHCHLTFAFVAFLWQRSALCLFKMSCSFWTVLYSSDCLWPFSCTFQPPSKHYCTHRICKFVNLHLWLEHFPTCLIHNTNTCSNWFAHVFSRDELQPASLVIHVVFSGRRSNKGTGNCSRPNTFNAQICQCNGSALLLSGSGGPPFLCSSQWSP